jgi:hypothetical protein
MSDVPPPLDSELMELLRDEDSAPPGARPRARARLAAVPGVLAAASPRGATSHGASAGSANGVSAVSSALGLKGVAAVAFVLGGAAGAGLHAAVAKPPEPRVVYLTAPAPNAESPPPRGSTASTSAPRSESTSLAREAPPFIPTPVDLSPRTSQLTVERSLLDDVRAALVRGDANAALEGLRVSRQKFAHPILAEERDALGVEALVSAGRYPEARAAAAQFNERFPKSLFSGSVEGAMGSIP